MARLWQGGFEQNSSLEFTALTGAAFTIQTAVVRSGAYAGKISGLSSLTRSGVVVDVSSAQNGPLWARFYFRVDTLPTGENTIFAFLNGATIASTISAGVTIDNTGALRLKNTAVVNVGSPSSALTLGQFYRVEVKIDSTGGAGAGILELYIDGVLVASSSTLTIANQFTGFGVGGNINAEAQTTGVWYFDDLALNNNTGSSQTAYPGDGRIVHALINGSGDNTQRTIGGSSPAATNWQSVNENTPDDAITLTSDNTTGHIDDFTVATIPDIASGDTINTVAVGVRYSGLGSGASNATLATRLKAITGGTTDQGTTITSNGTTYKTNGPFSSSLGYTLVDYLKPGTINPWTKADLTAAQIGVKTVIFSTSANIVSTLWLSVDFTVTGGTTTSTSTTTTTSTSTSSSTTTTSTSTSTTTSTSTSSSTTTTSTSTSTTTTTSTSTSSSTTTTSTSTSSTTSTSTTTTSTSTSTTTSTSSSTTTTSTSTSTTTSTSSSTTTTSTSTSTTTTTSTSTTTSSSTSTSTTTSTSSSTSTSTSTTITMPYYFSVEK